jgi:hypothetical protein
VEREERQEREKREEREEMRIEGRREGTGEPKGKERQG